MGSERVVLITGASRGIGRGTAISFAESGARVAINYYGSAEAAQETARLVDEAGGEPLVVRADVAVGREVRDMVQQVVDRFGRIDVAVLNAGVCPFKPFLEIDEELWDRTHAVNLKGAFLTAQAVARQMIDRRAGGNIVAVSSISAFLGGANQVHYCPTKAGLIAMMHSLAIVLGPHQIRCNTVLPGSIPTDINRADYEQPGKRAYLEHRVPLGRLGDPKEVGDAIRLLTEDGMRYVNGAELVIDGGMWVNFE